jgi:IS1 family transposase
MNKLSDQRRAQILRCLTEGTSIRATARITDTAKATVLKLLVEVGEFCSLYQDLVLRNLPCERIEADEIWAYVGAKRKNAKRTGDGDLWTFTAIDPDSKLMVSWLVGDRSEESATAFMLDLASRVSGKIQLTTDGHGMYLPAIRKAFSWRDVDYAMLVKTFGQPNTEEERRRYSPPVCTGAKKIRVIGNPNPDLVSTSYVERANLTMRMSMRRFTRLTNAFSRKAENHAHAVSLSFMFYNFCQPHGTLTKARGGLKTTPAMAARIADRPWRVEDILAKMDPDTPILDR